MDCHRWTTCCWRGVCCRTEIRSKVAATVAVYDLYGGEYEERMNYQAVVPGAISQNWHYKNKKSATILSIELSISP